MPIYKAGERNCLENHRPISLLSCVSKILERIISKQTTKYLEQNELLFENQYGFRKGHSTENALLKLTDHISMEKIMVTTQLLIS